MERPPKKGQKTADEKPRPGGRALQRLRQFERARGLGPVGGPDSRPADQQADKRPKRER